MTASMQKLLKLKMYERIGLPRVELGSIGAAGEFLLHLRIGLGITARATGDLQRRPGAQFTSKAFTSRLEKHGVQIRMDGRGRAMEHLYRTVVEDREVRGDLSSRPLGKGALGKPLFWVTVVEARPLSFREPSDFLDNLLA